MTSALYETTVVHVRHRPWVRAFRHRSYLWYVDLDDLPVLPRALAPFARFDPHTRRNLQEWLSSEGVPVPGGPVTMLAAARVAGYVFNPLTVFWCHHDDGQLACVVAEVHNTYGGRHRYLLYPDANGNATADKQFYVSPFLTVTGTYRLRLPEPGDRLAVSIELEQDNGRVMSAVLRGCRRPATTPQLLRLLLRYPLAPLRATAMIRLHGLALWLRRLPVVPRVEKEIAR